MPRDLAPRRHADPPMASPENVEELKFLSSEEHTLTREVALSDLWFFATQVLFPNTDGTHYYKPLHEPICRGVGTDTFGARKLILMPRNHRKTYIVTIAHAVWRIIRDPNVRIILVSALDDTASYFCQMVKRQFQLNDHFLHYFPEFRVKKDAQFGRTYDFTHPARDNTGESNLIDPTFRSFYLGAPVAGRRCDILLADDPIEKKHVTTPEQADKALKDFNDLLPIVDKTGKYNQIYVIGTRWSHYDIYAAMLGEDRGLDVNPELTAATPFESTVRHCLEFEDGSPVTDVYTEGAPILPTVWTRELLLKELEIYRQDPKRGEEDWWKQYMNICISPAGRKFEESYFDTWMPRLPGGIIFSFFVVDSATKDEQVLMRGDFTVIHVCHYDAYGHLYLTDGARSDKFKGMDLINELISMNQRCKSQYGINVTNFVKEKVGEDTFFGWVRSEFNRARLPLTIFPLSVRGQGRKYVRIIEALQHPSQARQIHFVQGYPRELHRTIVDEATHIGQWSHDDAIDALSLAFHPEIRKTPSPTTSQDWHPPRAARLAQLSTRDTTPGRFVQMKETSLEPKPWRTPNQPAPDPTGRFNEPRQGPGFSVEYDRGRSSPITQTNRGDSKL